jgi:hypothetical protein
MRPNDLTSNHDVVTSNVIHIGRRHRGRMEQIPTTKFIHRTRTDGHHAAWIRQCTLVDGGPEAVHERK